MRQRSIGAWGRRVGIGSLLVVSAITLLTPGQHVLARYSNPFPGGGQISDPVRGRVVPAGEHTLARFSNPFPGSGRINDPVRGRIVTPEVHEYARFSNPFPGGGRINEPIRVGLL